MKREATTPSNARLARLLVLTALVVATAALLAAPAGAATGNEYSNNGWYTGLEYADLPQARQAVQNEYSNSGWYTGLEYADLPQVRPSSADEGFPWEETTFGVGAALTAVLIAAMVVASRSRDGRLAAD